MTKILSLVLMAVAMLVASCSPTGTFVPITIASVQQATINACKFEPTASTVAGIIAAGVPGLGAANLVAAAICAAVSVPAAQARRATAAKGAPVPPPTVAGVVVDGKFVN